MISDQAFLTSWETCAPTSASMHALYAAAAHFLKPKPYGFESKVTDHQLYRHHGALSLLGNAEETGQSKATQTQITETTDLWPTQILALGGMIRQRMLFK